MEPMEPKTEAGTQPQAKLLQAPDYGKVIAQELQVKPSQVNTALRLFAEGNTIPFIARYRKEMTSELDENQLRDIAARYDALNALHVRKQEVLRLVEDQGLFENDEFAETFVKAVHRAPTLTEVEDLYRPYRPKRKTRASVAKERGLAPLLDWLELPESSRLSESEVLQVASSYVSDENGVPDAQAALQGACDIFAEVVADDAETRKWIRELTLTTGSLQSTAADADADSVYEMYYEYEEPVGKIVPHRVLAINRGEREGYLKIGIAVQEERVVDYLISHHVRTIVGSAALNRIPVSFVVELLKKTVIDAYRRLIAPAIAREVRSELTAKAEEHANHIFGENLRNLLLQPPLRGRVALGVDPAYRTGCKLAVVDPTGKLLKTHVIYPTPPQNKVTEAKRDVLELFRQFGIDLVVIGNGTASRETEAFVAECLSEYRTESEKQVPYVIVSEAGASVYSASKLAGEEFPKLDVAERSAVSIARRMQDPLAELVKIDPKSIGVGQYQHDVSQRDLDDKLTAVVESAVNRVGVDVNTASPSLLSYVAGLNKTVAKNIVLFREQNGRFDSRKQLSKVSRLGPKTLEQCVGFLRVHEGVEPLDATPIHPESYAVVKHLLQQVKATPEFFFDANQRAECIDSVRTRGIQETAAELGIGEPTLKDILEALERPGRDPREDVPVPMLRTDVLKLEDLEVGMVLTGTVRNVVDFGAFIDIGVKQDGLVHISQLANHYVKHPMDVVAVGDTVQVKVIQIDVSKGRVGLSMR